MWCGEWHKGRIKRVGHVSHAAGRTHTPPHIINTVQLIVVHDSVGGGRTRKDRVNTRLAATRVDWQSRKRSPPPLETMHFRPEGRRESASGRRGARCRRPAASYHASPRGRHRLGEAYCGARDVSAYCRRRRPRGQLRVLPSPPRTVSWGACCCSAFAGRLRHVGGPGAAATAGS